MSHRTNPHFGAFPADILIGFDRSSRGLAGQLQRELREAIQTGRLRAGVKLPPSRTMARDLGVSRGVVVEAYAQLVQDGYLESRQGSGTTVRELPAPPSSATATSAAPRPLAHFIGGLPDPALFPRREWQRHYRASLAALPHAQFGYPGPHGAITLRSALSDYLGRVRGVVTTPDQVLISSGFTQALVLICRALRDRGVEAIAVEDPCFAFHREAISVAGLRPVPVRVDGDGIDVAALAELEVEAVLAAPAHSYPTGAVLSPARRTRLANWARERDALIIEDDYDAEFRYDRAPVGALQGLAPEHVAYAGCASKTLSPALRMGWVALPQARVDEVARQKVFDDMGTPLLEQLAMARLLASGGFARHLRRVRPVYQRRRNTALTAVARYLPDSKCGGIEAGLHLYVQLQPDSDERELVRAAGHRGVLVEPADWHWADPPTAPPALVIGYGSLSEPAIEHGLAILGEVHDERRRGD